jgi:hypothetical protein
MRVETDFTILGYPGLAMIFFIVAVAGGVALLVSVARTDETKREDPDRSGPRHR